jgi:nitrogen fixation/metabolism regulation signal transduction histidine kinase
MKIGLSRVVPWLVPSWLRWLLVVCVVIAAITLFLLATAAGNTRLFVQHYQGLLVANGVLAAALAALAIFQLTRLVRRLRARVFGSRLTLRLVGMFALLAVLPGAIVYSVSVQFLQRSIESWFDVSIERALDSGLNLGRSALDSMLKELTDKANNMATTLAVRTAAEQPGALNDLREQAGVQEAALFSSRGRLLAVSAKEHAIPLPDSLAPAVLRQVRLQQAVTAVETVPERGLYLRTLVPVNVLSLAEDVRVLQLTQAVPPQLARDAEGVQAGLAEYQELTLARQGLKRLYGLTLTMALLLALLSAVSVAFLLSERLSAPLAELADATRAVAQGNFSRRVPVASTDELGVLTQSFNAMTQQLSEARSAAEDNQAQLATAAAYIESVLANVSTGVLAFDSALRVRSCNRSAAAILAVDINIFSDIPLDRWSERVPALEPLARELMAAFATGEKWQREFERPGPEGTQVLLLRGTPFAAGGENGFVAVFDDITYVVQAQRDAAWSEVARRLAHEIKNPLTPIQLSAERLQLKLSDKLSGSDAEMLTRATETIVNQVGALKHMVDAFRDYARMPEAVMQPVNLTALVREVLTLYGSLGRIIHAELAAGAPAITGDPTQLRQVIHNLLQNAQDALSGVPDPRIEIASTYTADVLRLSITDNGAGFPDKVLARAFEPYITTKPKGTGLGLSIVKKIIEEHGGRVELENLVPHGARVTVILPLARAAERTAA